MMDDPECGRRSSPQPPDCNAAWCWRTVRCLGAAARRRGTGGRRGLLQHRDDRLSGNPDRSLLCRADHHLHLSPYRQCRDQSPRISRPRHRPRAGSWCEPTSPSRPIGAPTQPLDAWLEAHGLIGLSGDRHAAADPADPRPGARPTGSSPTIRDGRSMSPRCGRRRPPGPVSKAWTWPREVTCRQSYEWDETAWRRESGYGRQRAPRFHVVAVDYGAKRNILRMLAAAWLPGDRGAGDRHRPRTSCATGPTASFCRTGPAIRRRPAIYAVPVLRELIDTGKPIFGICLGHQLLALALGGRTRKMERGHRGANHPVKDLATGKVEITSQNHGFVVDPDEPAGRRRSDPCLAVRQQQRGLASRSASRCSRCSTIPKRAPARRTATICSSDSSS